MGAESLGSELSSLSLGQIELSSGSWDLASILRVLIDSFNSEVFNQISCELVEWDLSIVGSITSEDSWELSSIGLHIVAILVHSSWEAGQACVPSAEAIFVLENPIEFLLIAESELTLVVQVDAFSALQ